MKDFSNIHYLRFSAQDPYEAEFYDVVIDLTTDCIISGIIKIGEYDSKSPRLTINASKGFDNLVNSNHSIFAKVVDSGTYQLLDDKMNAIYEHEGYVPKLMDYYNNNEGFGDYIDLTVDNLETGHLKHNVRTKIDFNDPDEWTEVNEQPNLYTKGMIDAFTSIKKIIRESDSNDIAVANIIITINNFLKNDITPA